MKKKVFCALLCTAMVASLTACGGSSSSTAADTSSDAATEETTEAADDTAEADTADAATSEGGKIFGYTCMDGTNPFFVTLEGAIREVVESHGDQLISMDPANDSNTQVNQIEDMISRGVEIMFVNPVDADGIIPALDMLKDAGIPMFGFDTQVGDMSYLTSYAGSDNYNAGYVCGEDLAKKVPDGGDILVLDSPTMQSVTDRTNGFLDAIKESGVTFNVVGQQDAQGNQQVAGVTPLIYGVDGSPDVKALLKDTILEGTGAQSPITIGETIANTAYEWLDGKEVESFIPIDTFLVTADNVDQYGTDGWQ